MTPARATPGSGHGSPIPWGRGKVRIRELHLPVKDGATIPPGVIDAAVEGGGSTVVYVHCRGGRERSATVAWLPGFGPALERLRTHADTSAALAAAAGCSARTVELIRDQDAPTDPEYGELLRLADEAN